MRITHYLHKTTAILLCSATLVMASDRLDETTPRKSISSTHLSLSRAVKAIVLTGLGLEVSPAAASIHYVEPAWLSGVSLSSWSSDALGYCYENCGVEYYCREGAPWRTFDECRETTKKRLIQEAAMQSGKIGLMAKYSLGEYVSDNERMSLYREAAEGGYDLAQYTLGQMLYDSNLPEAVLWLAKAAEQGNPNAGQYLAAAYLTDSAVGWDEAKAIDYYRKSTRSDLAKAEYEIGNLYKYGWKALPASNEIALQWYERAGERNYVPALLSLARIYFSGDFGVRRDASRAYELASRASGLGNYDASYYLATTILLDKTSAHYNVVEAIAVLKEIMDIWYNDSYSVYKDTPIALGDIYSSREYGVYDRDEALKYYRIADDRGNSESREKIKLLENRSEGVTEFR